MTTRKQVTLWHNGCCWPCCDWPNPSVEAQSSWQKKSSANDSRQMIPPLNTYTHQSEHLHSPVRTPQKELHAILPKTPQSATVVQTNYIASSISTSLKTQLQWARRLQVAAKRNQDNFEDPKPSAFIPETWFGHGAEFDSQSHAMYSLPWQRICLGDKVKGHSWTYLGYGTSSLQGYHAKYWYPNETHCSLYNSNRCISWRTVIADLLLCY